MRMVMQKKFKQQLMPSRAFSFTPYGSHLPSIYHPFTIRLPSIYLSAAWLVPD